MVKLSVEGNLGADAEVKRDNGRAYVQFRVADTQRRTDANGKVRERTQWISCFLNGDGGNLLPYLKKGARVHVYGDGDVNQYHSEKQHALVAGMTCFVRDVELVGAKPDAVPGELYDHDGVAHRVTKCYWTDIANTTVYNRAGQEFVVDANGWIQPVTAVAPQTDQHTAATDGQPAEAIADPSENNQPAEQKTKKSEK